MLRLNLSVCKLFHKFKHLDDNSLYLAMSQSLSRDLSSFRCPKCKAPSKLYHNGCYNRHLVYYHNDKTHDTSVSITDIRCTSCGATHAILPSLIVPYCSYSLNFIIALIYSHLTRRFNNIELLCEHFDISTRTFYRIINHFYEDVFSMRILLSDIYDSLDLVSKLYVLDPASLHTCVYDFFLQTGHSFMQPYFRFRLRGHVNDPFLNLIR